MTTVCNGIALLTCFAFFSSLTFTQTSASKIFEKDDIDAGRPDHSNERVYRSADSVDPNLSFLAGEDTPVWVAYNKYPICKNENIEKKFCLTYKKLETGIVRQAIDKWKSGELNVISKKKRSVDDNINLFDGDSESFVDLEDNVQFTISSAARRGKRTTSWSVYHPSVLAVMEYGNDWPSNKHDEQTLILGRIIYALAYWNSINIQLAPITKPWISLRLAGIVIGRDRDSTHHTVQVYGGKNYLMYEGTLHRMRTYWGNSMRDQFDFQQGTYNIVALMTDMMPIPGSEAVAASTKGLPCNRDDPKATGVLIAYDNLAFSGIQETLRVTARILGHGSSEQRSCTYRQKWKYRSWNYCDVDSIQTSLQSYGWCMKGPQDFHNPGKPVEIILPGMFMSWRDQCAALGPEVGNICRSTSCRELRCRADAFAGYPCHSWQASMDGSPCADQKICIDGECVDKRFYFHT